MRLARRRAREVADPGAEVVAQQDELDVRRPWLRGGPQPVRAGRERGRCRPRLDAVPIDLWTG